MKCPKCYSENIDQFRMPIGAIWCNDCGFKIAQKEVYNPFIKGNYLKKFIEYEDSTWDELAKEIVEFAPQDVADFIFCLLNNSDKQSKLDMFNMIRNIVK